jgi:hypothetical protein
MCVAGVPPPEDPCWWLMAANPYEEEKLRAAELAG